MLRANNARLKVTNARHWSGVTALTGAGVMEAYANKFSTNLSRNRFYNDAITSPFGASPEGYSHPQAWIPPRVAGSLKSYPGTRIGLTSTGELYIGRPLQGNSNIGLTSTGNLDMIVALSGSSTIGLSTTATLDGIINMSGSSSIGLTSSSALDMLVGLTGGSTIGLISSANLTGIISLESLTTEPGLTVENIAAAVWSAVAASNNTAGTMGEKLNDAGSAANPWTEVIEGSYTAEQLLRLIASVLAGKVTKTGDTYAFRNLQDSADRVTATTNSDGERLSITLNP